MQMNPDTDNFSNSPFNVPFEGMDVADIDIGEFFVHSDENQKNNIFQRIPEESVTGPAIKPTEKYTQNDGKNTNPQKRLNAFDSAILESNAHIKDEDKKNNVFTKFSNRVQNGISQAFGRTFKVLKSLPLSQNISFDYVKKSELFKRLKPVFNKSKLKATLDNLNEINNNVNELVNLKIPFGEKDARYKTLADNLIKANSVHSKLFSS